MKVAFTAVFAVLLTVASFSVPLSSAFAYGGGFSVAKASSIQKKCESRAGKGLWKMRTGENSEKIVSKDCLCRNLGGEYWPPMIKRDEIIFVYGGSNKIILATRIGDGETEDCHEIDIPEQMQK